VPDVPFEYFFGDDFNRADQALAATASWVVYVPGGSSFVLQSTKAYPLQGGSTPSAFYNQALNRNDSVVAVRLSVSGGKAVQPRAAVLGRYDTTSVATATVGYFCGFDGSNYLTVKRSGVVQANGNVRAEFDIGASYALFFKQMGTRMFCTVTGDINETIWFDDGDPFTGTYFGLTGGTSSYNYIFHDDFSVFGRGIPAS
jgi:hypothetical protein